MRSIGAPEGFPVAASRTVSQRDPSPARGNLRDAERSSGPGNRHHIGINWAAPHRSTESQGSRHHSGRCRVLPVPRKGGKQGKRELPRPAGDAIKAALAAWGKSLDSMAPEESLWPSPSGKGLLDSTFYTNLRRYLKRAGLPPSGVHVLRHSAAKLRRDAGESIEDVSRFLDHSSLTVTTTYLRRLEGQEDKGWGRVAQAIGL